MSDISFIAGSSPVASGVMVSADQVTIIGNGTVHDPLRVNPDVGGSSLSLAFEALIGIGGLVPGLPVVVGPSGAGGRPSIVGIGGPTAPRISGILVSIVGGVGVVQFGGVVDLPTADWDAVTGSTGGLEVGETYFVSMQGEPGLAPDAPSGSGFIIQIGQALSSTRLGLGLPFPFTQL